MDAFFSALRDPALFAPLLGDFSTRRRWLVCIAAMLAQPIHALGPFGISETEALTIYQHHTGRKTWPTLPALEAWIIAGRRSAKTWIAALVAVGFSCFKRYDALLAPGERAVFMLLAADKRQARQALRYINGFLDEIPMLSAMVERRTSEAVDLSSRVSIEVHVSNYRSVRGFTLCGVVCDEIAFWRDDTSTNPATEVLNAIRPARATIPGAPMISVTTPYARGGPEYATYRDHYGKDGSDIFVWRGTTLEMNPTISPALVERAYAADPIAAAAEYGAQFRRDIEAFLSREAVEACVVPGRLELPPIVDASYSAFTDPSGGSADSFTLAIGHEEEERTVLDLLREVRPPFSPEGVVADFTETLRRYRVSEVTGDRYGAEWVAEAFRKADVQYKAAEKPKSDLYRELLPSINSGRVELLDHPKLLAQLVGLERRTARGGRDSIDHAPRGHDDIANVVAGLVHMMRAQVPLYFASA